jgi:hypothetical protein
LKWKPFITLMMLLIGLRPWIKKRLIK